MENVSDINQDNVILKFAKISENATTPARGTEL